jgi:ribosomal protein S6
VKRYEALFILHNPTKEEGIKEAIDHLTAEITAQGGQVETVQKMDRKPFVRAASKKVTSGFYVNLIFSLPEANLIPLRHRFVGLEEVFRVIITQPTSVATPATPATPA